MTALDRPQSALAAREHWLAEGQAQLAGADFEAAIESFEHAVMAAQRSDWVPLLRLAEAYLALGSGRAAFAAFQEAAERRLQLLDDGNPDVTAKLVPESLAAVAGPAAVVTARWAGQTLLGRSLRVERARSLAEAIASLRLVIALAAHGVDMVLVVPALLRPLAARMAGPRLVVADNDPAPPADFTIPYAALPIAAAGLPLPACPLVADPARRLRMRVELPATRGLLLGMVDGSADTRESLATIARAPGVHVTDLSRFRDDFETLAAAMASVDMVLTADHAIAHLGGSLGVATRLFVATGEQTAAGAGAAMPEPALRDGAFAHYADVRIVRVEASVDGGAELAGWRADILERAARTPLVVPVAPRARGAG